MKKLILSILLPLVLIFGTGAGMQGERPGAVGSFNVATGEANSRNAFTQFQVNGTSWGLQTGAFVTVTTSTIYNDYCGSIYYIVGDNEGGLLNPTITISDAADVPGCKFTFISGTDENVTIATTSAAKFRGGVGVGRLADTSMNVSDIGIGFTIIYTNDGFWQLIAGDEDAITWTD